MQSRIVGQVVALNRYPVKSMRGEPLEKTRVWWHGLEGNRRYAFLCATSRSHFPWLTAREVPQLLACRPSFHDPSQPVTSPVEVALPDSRVLAVESEALRSHLASLAGEALHLLHLGRGAFDSMGVSLITTKTVESVSLKTPSALAPERFRGNILVETADAAPYPEDDWLGGQLVFGSRPDSTRIRVVRPIPRCGVVNLDPVTTQRNPDVLRAIVRHHDKNAGVYGATEQVGTIFVGDTVALRVS